MSDPKLPENKDTLAPGAGASPGLANPPAKPDHRIRFAVGMVVLGVVLFFAFHYVADGWLHESTDDAFVDGHVVSVASKVAGEVLKSYVVENQSVKAGDLLVQLDSRDYDAKVAQKKAALQSSAAYENALKASFELVKARVTTADATARQSEAEAASSKAGYDNAMANWNRAQHIWSHDSNGVISDQDFDAAKTAMTMSQANWNAAVEKAAGDRSKIAESHAQVDAAEKLYEQASAQVAQAQADVNAAELELSYTRITAPVDGRIARKMVEQGGYVQTGQNLFALVRPEVWVTANFKETQLAKMRPRQKVTITVDALAGKTFAGHVDSLQSGSGARFSLLPPENAVGNYVKVVQRVPVKILFDDPVTTEDGLGPGMSAEPSVSVSDATVSDSAVAVAAAVATILAGSATWLVIRRG